MVTPFTGFPLGSLTITASGLGRVCPAFTTCPSPLVGALARAFCGGGMPPPPPPQAMLMIVVASAAKRDRRESAMPHLRVSRGETPYTPGRPLRCLTGRRGRRICSTRPPLSTDAPSGAAPFGRPPGGSVRQGPAADERRGTRPPRDQPGRRCDAAALADPHRPREPLDRQPGGARGRLGYRTGAAAAARAAAGRARAP